MKCKECSNLYAQNVNGLGKCRVFPGNKQVGKKRRCHEFNPVPQQPARYFFKEFISKTKYRLKFLSLADIKKAQEGK